MHTVADSRVVSPGTTRLTLTNGDWLVVKQRLNAGETMDLFERAAPAGDTLAKVPATRVGLALISAYLLDWSITDLQGAVLPIRGASAADIEGALRLLDFDSLVEIMNAVTAHDGAVRQEKKTRLGVSVS